jgi:RimJ/RimL family protein N-acetyltransferase
MHLRAATEHDVQTIFAWRNDPWIVELSARRTGVAWDQHVRWFNKVLHSGEHLLFVIEGENGGMGCVRLDRQGVAAAVVTIYLLQPYVGRGFGVAALRQACQAAFQNWSQLQTVHAYIRPENTPSLKAFAKAGFVKGGQAALGPEEPVEMILTRVPPVQRRAS